MHYSAASTTTICPPHAMHAFPLHLNDSSLPFIHLLPLPPAHPQPLPAAVPVIIMFPNTSTPTQRHQHIPGFFMFLIRAKALPSGSLGREVGGIVWEALWEGL